MVNQRAKNAVLKKDAQDSESRERGKRIQFKRTYVGAKQKILNVTFIQPPTWTPYLWIHGWAGKKGLKFPVICPRRQYDQKDCDICEMEGNFGECYPTLYRIVLAYVHDYEGKMYKGQDGKSRPIDPVRFLEVPKGGEDKVHWAVMDELEDSGRFNKCVVQVQKLKKGIRLRPLPKKVRLEMDNKGIVPKSIIEKFSEFTEDDYWGHVANLYKGFDYEHFDVPELVVSKETHNDEDNASEDYSDDEDEDEDENEYADGDDDEDEEDADKAPSRKKKATPPAKKSSSSSKSSGKPKRKEPEYLEDEEEDEDEDSEDDESDDDYDFEDDEEEEAAPPPRKKKKKVAPAATSSGSSTKRRLRS